MCQKSAINSPETAVTEMLEGIGFTNPGLHVQADEGIVLLDKDRGDNVALVCGCGAGYEPFAAGYVGEGMLTAFISGKLGKPPRAGVILKVLARLSELNKGGTLILILNHARDVLNFGLAIERARNIGLKVEAVVLVDDCSRWKMMREEQETNLAYKRGVAGSVFAFKILGALSSAGASISHIVNEARNINFRLTTLGFLTEPFCYPGANRPAYTLRPNEVVIGMGINGEHGIKSIEFTSARDVVRNVMGIILDEAKLSSKSGVFVMFNRFSSMTVSEGYVLAKEVYKYLAKKKVNIWRLLVGQFMTSYDAKGAHISLLNVSGKGVEWLQLLEMETEAYAWPNTKMSSIDPECERTELVDDFGPQPKFRGGMHLNRPESKIFRKVVESVCRALMEAEVILNQLNAYNGNADCGTNLRLFARAILQRMNSDPDCYRDPSMVFQIMERCAEEEMEGSIGSVYAALLYGAGCNTTSWPHCFQGAVKFLGTYFPIARGHGTLFDVIFPACEEFVDNYNQLGEEFWRAALQLAVDKAEKSCVETFHMKPKVGVFENRARMNMDAGAYSVVVWMRAVNNMLKILLPFDRLLPPETEDWRHRLQYLLLTLRPIQPSSPLKRKLMNLPFDQSNLDFIDEDECEEEEDCLDHEI